MSSDGSYEYERRSHDATRHWYEYRAYFFRSAGPGMGDNASADSEQSRIP